MTLFRLPDLGEGLQEAELVAWHVAIGDNVVADQPLASVETDKAVVEIPVPFAGHIVQLLGQPGDVIEVGAPLAEISESGRRETGTVVGRLPEDEPASDPPSARGEEQRALASPAVRSLAQRLGVELAAVPGSGPQGAVTRADVEAAAGSDSAVAKAVPLRGVRRNMARKMAEAHKQVVPATVNDLADIGSWRGGEDITLRLIRAVVRGCAAQPALNAWYLGPEEGRVLNRPIDLGIAVDTEDGLFVPVLRDVGSRAPEDLRRGLEALKADVQARRIPLSELRGQTITLSNFGMFGGRHAALVVLPPQVAILGAGRIHQAVVAQDERPKVSCLLPLSLTFDHRVVMGGEAAGFLAAVVGDLEQSD
jgi:2-oxoisovalerate dehydrogenase E2 component (dihydrolipoyl transacylase)